MMTARELVHKITEVLPLDEQERFEVVVDRGLGEYDEVCDPFAVTGLRWDYTGKRLVIDI